MMRKLLLVVGTAAAVQVLLSGSAYAQVDLAAMAEQSQAKSADLQKKLDGLKNQREEVKKEAAAVQAEEKKVEQAKAAAQGGAVRVTVRGDRVIERNGETFLHFIERRSRTFPSYDAAIAEMRRFDLAPDYSGVSITDAATGETLTGPPPKPDSSALDAANKALADRQAAYDQAVQKYRADKAAYDQDLAAYTQAVNQLNQALPAAVQEARSPTPTPDQLNAPKGDYPVENIAAVATTYRGKAAKDGTSAALLQEVAKVPDPSKWGKGDKVQGAALRPGTPVATFKADGAFTPGNGSHSALYITQNKKGMWVYDQYKTASGEQRPVDARFIRFKNGTGNPANDASAYSVIKKSAAAPDLPPPKK